MFCVVDKCWFVGLCCGDFLVGMPMKQGVCDGCVKKVGVGRVFCSCGFVVMGLETASPNDGSVGRDGDRVGGAPREMARCWFFDFGAL